MPSHATSVCLHYLPVCLYVIVHRMHQCAHKSRRHHGPRARQTLLPGIRVKVQGLMTSVVYTTAPVAEENVRPQFFSGLETRQWCLSMNIIQDPALPKVCPCSTVPGDSIIVEPGRIRLSR